MQVSFLRKKWMLQSKKAGDCDVLVRFNTAPSMAF
jgi:hypothetical protein